MIPNSYIKLNWQTAPSTQQLIFNLLSYLSFYSSQAELSKHEETVYRERREREEALAELKKQAEEKKAHAERVERRLQRASIQHDELTPEQNKMVSGEEQEKKISSFEEAFLAIKEATGVSDLQVGSIFNFVYLLFLSVKGILWDFFIFTLEQIIVLNKYWT